MAGKAVLTCRQNSHPFQERTLNLEQPVKIGRSVARTRAAVNNAIFDCKVLSRNHAVLWYSNGMFYLQDTKSSNGTFVNNQRLSKSGDESSPRAVYSGDIIQFGVDVLENTRKVTHGCIVANLKLYLPDGKEAKASNSSAVMAYPIEDFCLLNQYIQEASQREEMISKKLNTLRNVLCKVRQAADQGWKTLIAEDCLLSRLEMLENQLQVCSKNIPEDKLREELRQLQQDKLHYQTTAKELLKKSSDENIDITERYQRISRSFQTLEAEFDNVSKQLVDSQEEIDKLAQKLSAQTAKSDEFESKLKEIEEQHKISLSKLEQRNKILEHLLESQYESEELLEKRISELEKIENFSKKRGAVIDYEHNKPANNASLLSDDSFCDTSVIRVDIPSENLDEHHNMNNLGDQKKNKEVLDLYTAQLNLLHSEKEDKVYQISIEDDWGSYEKMCAEDKALESNPVLYDYDDIETSSTDTLMGDYISEDEEVTTSVHSNNLEALNTHTHGLRSLPKDMRVILDPSGNIMDQDLINKSSRISEGKLENELDTLVEHRNDLLRVQQDNLENIDWRNHDEEKEALKKQLIEAKQVAKQSRNEAAQLADRLRLLSSDLESRRDDNRTKEELDTLREDYCRLQTSIAALEAKQAAAGAEIARLQSERDELEISKMSAEAESTEKVLRLEEELAIVGTKYIHCNEERTQLNRELNSLKLDYEAVTHQPYFNLLFALPCVVLFIAIIIGFYPTLSRFTGTSDRPE
ncbi:hypothetical protein AAG570_003002 [Ranatra chinensis]|uniref:Sarcolemmal membrane-associated protein n=1 Tax=Ranatra chinensis TaxID=642074 RepID=A0ABD0Y5I0_9HEMI